MVENTRSSAFAATVGRLEELTESELRQLHLIIGVRLGLTGSGETGATAGKSSLASTPRRGKTSKRSGSARAAKGNPQRKSQWANHPLWQEYHRLKKLVEAQAKEAKTSFNSVDSPERRAYQQALSQWLEAKSSFRDRKTANESSSEEESEGEQETKSPPTRSAGAAGPSSESAGQSSAGSGETAVSSPPSKGKEKAKTPPGGKST